MALQNIQRLTRTTISRARSCTPGSILLADGRDVLISYALVGLLATVIAATNPVCLWAQSGPSQQRARSRVLFDVAHNNLHRPTGRYRPFADLIAADGYRITENRVPFRADTLAQYDILIISNALGDSVPGSPSRRAPAFTPTEIEAVRSWVASGGSLLLVADHAPAGSTAAALAAVYGVEMRSAYTIDPVHFDSGSGELGQLIFMRPFGLPVDHPIMRGRAPGEAVSRVVTFTGQSLSLPDSARALLRLSPTAVDVFFTEQNYKSAQGRVQGLTLRVERGRVAILGEAAMLTDQGSPSRPNGINYPGFQNRQFALNLLHWLSADLDA